MSSWESKSGPVTGFIVLAVVSVVWWFVLGACAVKFCGFTVQTVSCVLQHDSNSEFRLCLFSDWRMDFPNPKKCIRGEVVAVRCEATGGVCHSPIHSRRSEFGSVRHLCGIQREKFCETLQNPTQRWFSAGGVDAGI